jgi:hypothetical protein
MSTSPLTNVRYGFGGELPRKAFAMTARRGGTGALGELSLSNVIG